MDELFGAGHSRQAGKEVGPLHDDLFGSRPPSNTVFGESTFHVAPSASLAKSKDPSLLPSSSSKAFDDDSDEDDAVVTVVAAKSHDELLSSEDEPEVEAKQPKGKEKDDAPLSTMQEHVDDDEALEDKIYDISVTSFHVETPPGESAFAVYHIALHSLAAAEPHIIHKRFSHFITFNTKLERHYPEEELPSLPSRLVLPGKAADDTVLVEERKTGLEKYLKELLTLHPRIFFSFHTRLFLGLFDLDGKVAIVTGASSGLGLETTRYLASMGAHVIMACRAAEKTSPLVFKLQRETKNQNIEYMHLNLASFKSIRTFVNNFHAKGLPLHLLINNAAVLGDTSITEDDFEAQFGVNYLGHFLLTNLLLQDLIKVPDSRIVNVSSPAHTKVPAVVLDPSYIRVASPFSNALNVYYMSKLAQVLFTAELSQRLIEAGATTMVHTAGPLNANTELLRNMPTALSWMLNKLGEPPEIAAKSILYAAVADETATTSGCFLDDCKETKASVHATNKEALRQLWEQSEKWTGLQEDDLH